MNFLGGVKSIGLLLIINSFGIQICVSQTINYFKPIPVKYLPTISDLAVYRKSADSLVAGAYDLTNCLPQGYVTDGSVDYTNYLQSAIRNNHKIIFPNFPVLVNNKGLALISNSIVLFNKHSKIIMMPNEFGNYFVLGLYDIQNVKIYFPVILGDRKSHTGNRGEWGMGLSINGATNVDIVNPMVSNCWGDGIYIGKSKQPSKSIRIFYPVVDNNRRNGISVVSVDDFTLIHAVAANNYGVEPMAAIDIEPNSNTDIVNNIKMDRPVTFNSKRGIMIVLLALPGPMRKQVNIDIENQIDDQSYTAFHYSGLKDSYNGEALGGNIHVINPVWKNNKIAFGHGAGFKFAPQLQFKNVKITTDKEISILDQQRILNKIKTDIKDKDKIIIQ